MPAEQIQKPEEYLASVLDKVSSGQSWATEIEIVPQTEGGSAADCEVCGETLVYRATSVAKKTGSATTRIICSLVQEGTWQDQLEMHPKCYKEIGMPYGEPLDGRKHIGQKAIKAAIASTKANTAKESQNTSAENFPDEDELDDNEPEFVAVDFSELANIM